jgi:hypothetical protein
MTTKDTPDESGGFKGTYNAKITISEGTDYGDEPPRILMGINDAPVQAPEGAEFNGSELMRHELKGAFDKDKLLTVLRTVRKRLNDDYKAVWKTQEKPILGWSTDKNDERWAQMFSERYVGITYGGPGQMYFSGGQWDGYIFSRVQPKMRKVTTYEYDSVVGNKHEVARRGTTQIAKWADPEAIVVENKRPPNGVFLGDWENNDDPAIPIIGSCQQTTSYGAVAHGFTTEDDLQYAGYPASENAQNLPIFMGKKPIGWPGEPAKGGKFYSVGSSGKGDVKFESLMDLHALRDPAFATDPAKIDPPMAPGTIITYNPHGFIGSVQAMVTLFEEKQELMRVRAEICRAIQGNPDINHPYKPPARDQILAPIPTQDDIAKWLKNVTRPGIPGRNKNEGDKEYETRKAKWDNDRKDDWKLFNDQWNVIRERTIELPKSVQDPGSHITFVLRVSNEADPAKRRVQLFDTSSNTAYWVMEYQARRGLIARTIEGGVMDSCAFPNTTRKDARNIPANSPMVGIGVTPKPDPAKLEAQLASLENARPVGLLRFVLTVRKPPEEPKPPSPWKKAKPQTPQDTLGPDLFPGRFTWLGDIHKDEVLYISRLLRMYGDKPNENFYITRLLRSLRATPFFTNIQAWWFVFAPTGLLAKSMWAQDGREMRPRDFVKTVLKLPKYYDKVTPPKAIPDPWTHRSDLKFGTHYQLTHVLTATGSDVPGRVGKAFTWCRKKAAMADGGATSLKVEGFSVPKDILAMLDTLGVGDEYAVSQLQGAVPAPDDGRAGSDEIDWYRYG